LRDDWGVMEVTLSRCPLLMDSLNRLGALSGGGNEWAILIGFH